MILIIYTYNLIIILSFHYLFIEISYILFAIIYYQSFSFDHLLIIFAHLIMPSDRLFDSVTI